MKTALITGVTGQDGTYLSELLLEKGYHVFGLNRRKAKLNDGDLTNILRNKNFEFLDGDLQEINRLNQIISSIKPDEIYNLAAQSFVPYSWTNPIYTCDVNALGVLRMLEAIRLYSPDTKFYQASSSEIFGKVQSMPQNEITYHYPRSPYGCSKSFGFNITRNYRESYGLFACNGILFNHESERRGMQFVTRKITRTVAEIKMGLSKKLILGNLDAKRDWGYAPDYVEAMWLMLQYKNPDDYIIASGEEHSVREFTELAFKNIDIDIIWKGTGLNEKGYNKKNDDLLVEVSKKFFRPAEVDILKGDSSKAKDILGWKPKVSFKEMIKRMINFDINEIKRSVN
ncbi:MAG: GDP-mannose 4,6-dehydratase [Thermoplasmata archaeon M9B1D]|nr:MAG: GDP-mannose 4,6-dehydratase [Thermoplasmata archaeon M8B2D]PNX49587.1 MAG: GDP-mannose 4,6-dehydratase [Thermoplasmata archaeon M9B1D]